MRPIRVRSLGRVPSRVLLLVLLVATAACASGGGGGASAEPGRDSAPGGYHGCLPSELASTGTSLGDYDLTGSGRSREVRLVPLDARRCPASLITERDGRLVGASTRGLDLRASTARAVRLLGPGRRDLLMVSTSTAVGVQRHLFGQGLRELTVGGAPLLPVDPTGARVPLGATCPADGGIAVVTATAHQPPGIVLAWDVTRTTYDVSSGRAVRTGRTVTQRAVADPTLHRERPGLFDGRVFAGC